jgi:hypothetical protein
MDKVKLLSRLKEVCTHIKQGYEDEGNVYQAVRYDNLLQSINKEIKYEERNREKRTEQTGHSE